LLTNTLADEKGVNMLSVCGVNCSTDCHAFGTDCEGCNQLQGKVSWAPFLGRECCPIYDCVSGKGLKSCGDCGLAPCSVWYETRNPDATDAEFEADLKSRSTNLEQRNKESS
jgi:hypothetical protein